MRYGAFGLVEVVGSSNAVIVIDQMLKTADRAKKNIINISELWV